MNQESPGRQQAERVGTASFAAAQALGGAIRGLRRERRWSIEYLAERASLSYQYVSEIETGKRNFSVDVLERVAGALQVSVAGLVVAAYPASGRGLPGQELPRAA